MTIESGIKIPKFIADIADKHADKTGFTQNTVDDAYEISVAIDEPKDQEYSETLYNFCSEHPEIVSAYLNPLTRKYVEVEK